MNAHPLSPEQLVIMFALLALLLWILSFLEDKAESVEIEPRRKPLIGPGPKPR